MCAAPYAAPISMRSAACPEPSHVCACREISQMAWQGAGQIKHRLLGLDRLAGRATVARPYVYASLSSGWASALAREPSEWP